MSPAIINLYDIIAEIGETRAQAILSTFKCSIDPDAEKFFKNTSIKHKKDSISRMYLVIEKGDTKDTIKGFFTLAVK